MIVVVVVVLVVVKRTMAITATAATDGTTALGFFARQGRSIKAAVRLLLEEHHFFGCRMNLPSKQNESSEGGEILFLGVVT